MGKFFWVWMVGFPLWALAWGIWKLTEYPRKFSWWLWDKSYAARERVGINSRPAKFKLSETGDGNGSEGNGTTFP